MKTTNMTEKLKMFETQFFNMLNTQSKAFDSFKIKIPQNGNIVIKKGIEAIVEIEKEITSIRLHQGNDSDILQFLSNIDTNDQIYRSIRRFYITVNMISNKLSNINGFTKIDRKSYFLTLIKFTDFYLLRLLMISIQFINNPITTYLKENEEFNSALQEVGINWNLY